MKKKGNLIILNEALRSSGTFPVSVAIFSSVAERMNRFLAYNFPILVESNKIDMIITLFTYFQ